ncbi:helix-turn-helix transcriptional regulator [Pseudomonas fluorescens]|uniref:HTH luxR-type domain-containing protein n=1 Tax=Pseudomonas fluorescens TaxID=294 RepID=A0A5E7A184_PSEFL|nr:LuxR C-terminal-related transcriptional regulator [Pseudomonas fluorescens]VVN70291.1 hypothetical protein PS704_00378 [Pseudomonas fluorescens]
MTNRELEILRLLLNGKSNKQIAITLGISDFTVRDYVSSILRKNNVGCRSELFAATLKNITAAESDKKADSVINHNETELTSNKNKTGYYP